MARKKTPPKIKHVSKQEDEVIIVKSEITDSDIKKAKEQLNSSTVSEAKLKQLIKHETTKQLIKSTQNITDEDAKIAGLYAAGYKVEEIANMKGVKQEHIHFLLSNPAFLTQVRKELYEGDFVSKDNLIRNNARIGEKLFNAFLTMSDEKLENMSPDKLLKSMKELAEFQHKLVCGDKLEVKIDITEMIKERIRDKKRVEVDNEGEVIIDSEFTYIDE